MKTRSTNIIWCLFVVIVTLLGCTSTLKPDDFNKIKITLENSSIMPDGNAYSLILKNESNSTIKQNTVYLSYSIRTANGSKGNNFKIEAKGNKLDIKPNEQVLLSVFAPSEEFQNNSSLDIDHPYLEIEGYMNQVSIENHFQKSGSIGSFN